MVNCGGCGCYDGLNFEWKDDTGTVWKFCNEDCWKVWRLRLSPIDSFILLGQTGFEF